MLSVLGAVPDALVSVTGTALPSCRPHPLQFESKLFATMDSEIADANKWLYNDHELDYSTPAPLYGSSGSPPPSQRGRGRGRRGRANFDSQNQSQVLDDASPFKCRPYTVIWTLYKKRMRRNMYTGDTVQNIDCYPSVFWDTSFKSEIDAIVKEKKLTDTHEPDETQIIVSINARGVEDITMRSPGLDIDWNGVNQQIDSWSDLVHDGRKLTIRIAFIFKENSQVIPARTDRRAGALQTVS